MEIIEGKEMLPPRIVYYALPGFGKTTFASYFPNPILIRTEDGARNIPIKKFKPADTYMEFGEQLKFLCEGEHDFKTCIVDTVDALESLINADVCAQAGKKDFGEIGWGRGEKSAAAEFVHVLEMLDFLNRERGMIIFLIAHSVISEVKDPIIDSYDRYRINLNEKYVLPVFERWADAILFGNYRIRVKEAKDANGKKTSRAVGNFDQRVMYCEGKPSFLAKNRYHLPPEIELTSEVSEVEMDAKNLLNLIREDMKS